MTKLGNNILFIPFYIQCPHLRTCASARIRAEWPAKYLGAEICQDGNSYTYYDLIIFQKCYSQKFQDYSIALKKINPKVKLALDLCDADWINRYDELKSMIDKMDFIIASTNQIKKWIQKNFPDKVCYKIPDGHDLVYYEEALENGEQRSISLPGPIHYIWYGNSGTIKSLKAILPVLERVKGKGDTLTIIADERAREAITSLKIDIKFVIWELNSVNYEVIRGNLVLNPRMDTPEYAVKSNNKTVMSYILGRPCIDRLVTDESGWMADLIKFRNPEFRAEDVAQKRPELIEKYGMDSVGKTWEKTLAKELGKC